MPWKSGALTTRVFSRSRNYPFEIAPEESWRTNSQYVPESWCGDAKEETLKVTAKLERTASSRCR
jgi:hypothetical protein